MGEPFADPDDVAVRWRPLSAAEIDTASALIIDASAYLRGQYPDLDSRLAAGTIDPDILTAITVSMVKRSMIGGGAAGVSAQSESAGPFSASYTFANPNGNLFITAAEDAFIRGYQPRAKSVRFA